MPATTTLRLWPAAGTQHNQLFSLPQGSMAWPDGLLMLHEVASSCEAMSMRHVRSAQDAFGALNFGTSLCIRPGKRQRVVISDAKDSTADNPRQGGAGANKLQKRMHDQQPEVTELSLQEWQHQQDEQGEELCSRPPAHRPPLADIDVDPAQRTHVSGQQAEFAFPTC